MLLSIITLNYKTPHTTILCIQSIQKQFTREFSNNEIEHIIIDNNSGDDSLEQLHKVSLQYKNVQIIKSATNLGFSKGCNLGVTHAKGTYILFLNSDAQIVDKSVLEMLEFLQKNPEVGIVGGQLKNSDDSLQASASKFYTLVNLSFLLIGWGKSRVALFPKKAQKVDWVTGACMMAQKDIFKKIGMFDERIFMYTEDMEVCLRAKNLGYDTFLFPACTVIHATHGSSNRSFAIVHIYQGIRYFYKKHFPMWQYRIANFLLCCKAIILVIIGVVTRNTYLRSTYEKALTIF